MPSSSPVVAEVVDIDKLQSSLKKTAQKGDYVLLYDSQQRVIIYRPSIDRVVDVQPILYGKQPNPDFEATVAVLNGSGDDAKLKKFIENMYRSYPNIQLIVKDNAPRLFPDTIVFAANDSGELPAQIAETLTIKAGVAPNGIATGNAELAFIVGQDYK